MAQPAAAQCRQAHAAGVEAAVHGQRLAVDVAGLPAAQEPHCLRDLTRGGLASALQELAEGAALELRVQEPALPVIEPVARVCDLLGFEPLHLANEGRFLAVVPPEQLQAALAVLAPVGGAWIGTVAELPAGLAPRVLLATALGTERLLLPTSGELLPRIC